MNARVSYSVRNRDAAKTRIDPIDQLRSEQRETSLAFRVLANRDSQRGPEVHLVPVLDDPVGRRELGINQCARSLLRRRGHWRAPSDGLAQDDLAASVEYPLRFGAKKVPRTSKNSKVILKKPAKSLEI